MARRFSLEQVAQKYRVRPFSTAVVQVSGGTAVSPGRGPACTAPDSSEAGVAPQKAQTTGSEDDTGPAYARPPTRVLARHATDAAHDRPRQPDTATGVGFGAVTAAARAAIVVVTGLEPGPTAPAALPARPGG